MHETTIIPEAWRGSRTQGVRTTCGFVQKCGKSRTERRKNESKTRARGLRFAFSGSAQVHDYVQTFRHARRHKGTRFLNRNSATEIKVTRAPRPHHTPQVRKGRSKFVRSAVLPQEPQSTPNTNGTHSAMVSREGCQTYPSDHGPDKLAFGDAR